ncbi:MAG: glycosyltransferase family 39 protein [Microcoleaceae cyanobacterium]
MSRSSLLFQEKLPRSLLVLLSLAIAIGILFRFIALDRKVYWFDEVYTNLRAAGYRVGEVKSRLFQNQIFTAPQLQQYQTLKPNSTVQDTLQSLVQEDAQHPPLYFLLARVWMQQFGGSIVASRSLPVLLSLLALPAMYALAWELFHSQLVSWLAMAVLALSPFDILFAQTARQYSLLTVLIIVSSCFLLRAITTRSAGFWIAYSFVTIFGFYTHPFFGLTSVGHAAYILLNYTSLNQLRRGQVPEPRNFLIAIALALIPCIPWIQVIISGFEQISVSTGWTKESVSGLYAAKLWLLGFTSLLVDINPQPETLWMYLLRIPFALLIVYALYWVSQTASREARLFILTSIFVPFIMLLLPDLLMGGKRSIVTRYLISCFPGVQLAVSYLLATHINTKRFSLVNGALIWRGVLVIVLTASIVSCSLSAVADTWWSKGVSYFNAEVANQLNQAESPIVVIDQGNQHLNFGNTLSLSYRLKDDVQLLLVNQTPDLGLIPAAATVYSFAPSDQLLQMLSTWVEKQPGRRLEQINPQAGLWKISAN